MLLCVFVVFTLDSTQYNILGCTEGHTTLKHCHDMAGTVPLRKATAATIVVGWQMVSLLLRIPACITIRGNALSSILLYGIRPSLSQTFCGTILVQFP